MARNRSKVQVTPDSDPITENGEAVMPAEDTTDAVTFLDDVIDENFDAENGEDDAVSENEAEVTPEIDIYEEIQKVGEKIPMVAGLLTTIYTFYRDIEDSKLKLHKTTEGLDGFRKDFKESDNPEVVKLRDEIVILKAKERELNTKAQVLLGYGDSVSLSDAERAALKTRISEARAGARNTVYAYDRLAGIMNELNDYRWLIDKMVPEKGESTSKTVSDGEVSQATKIREWAKENGLRVSSRGRIPAEISEAYYKVHGKPESEPDEMVNE